MDMKPFSIVHVARRGALVLALLLAAPRALSASPVQLFPDGVFAALPGGVEMDPAPALAPVFFHDARLERMVDELGRSSPTAARMLTAIRGAGFPLSFGTFHDLAEEMRQEYSSWDPTRKRTVGYMAPVVRPLPGARAPLTTVKILVALNLDRLDEIFTEARAKVPESAVSWDEIQRLETLAVLAHELVHAYGLAVAGGDPHLGCPDPAEDESPETACVVIGENLVRRELGAPLDWGYGVPSLVELAGRYEEAEARRAELLAIALTPLLRLPAPLGFSADR